MQGTPIFFFFASEKCTDIYCIQELKNRKEFKELLQRVEKTDEVQIGRKKMITGRRIWEAQNCDAHK